MADSGRGVVNIDLSPYSLAGRTSVHPVMFMLGIFAWFFVLLGIAGAGAGGLAIALGILTLVVVFGGFIWTSIQRLSASTTGAKDPYLPPEHLNATPPASSRSFAAILQAKAARAEGHGEDASWRKAETRQAAASQRTHAMAYTIGGVVFIILGLPLVILLRLGGALLGPAILLVIAGGFSLFTRGRRAMLASADTAMKDDPRPPILFLRSFKDDKVKLKQKVHVAGLPTAQLIRFEEALGFMVRGYGPFLAIGEPGEGLPQLGAARAYLSDDKWQEAVLTWIRQSQLIVMLCGPTKWIGWEVQNIVAAGAMERLLLMLPPGRGAQVQPERRKLERWDNILKSLAETPWGPALQALDIADVTMIRFQRDGQIVVYRSRGDFVQDYELAATVAIDSIASGPSLAGAAASPISPVSPASPARAPDAPRVQADIESRIPVDRMLPAKLAGAAAVAGLVAVFVARTGMNPGPAIIIRAILLAVGIGAGIRLFYDDRPNVFGWFAGAVGAGYLVASFGLYALRPPYGVSWVVVTAFMLGALSFRFKNLRHGLTWASILGISLVMSMLAWVLLRTADGPRSFIVGLGGTVLPWSVFAACLGVALTKRRATV